MVGVDFRRPVPGTQPGPRVMSADRLHFAVEQAYETGYVAGARSGRLAAFLWGLVLGACSVVGALHLGLASV
jgi:hypothetical protein